MSVVCKESVEDVLDNIPTTYGLRQVELKYKLLACHNGVVAIGTDSDVIICYDRITTKVTRVVPQGWKGLTSLTISQTIVCWGTVGGHVGARDISAEQREEITIISGVPPPVLNSVKSNSLLSQVHQSPVSTVAMYGNTVYSADVSGVIVRSDISWLRGSMAGLVIHNEDSKVYRLKPINNNLVLVAGLNRTFVLEVGLMGTKVVGVGKKDRKAGQYGCCVINESTVLICRPGYRLWVATVEGHVLRTIQLRPTLIKCEMGPLVDCGVESLPSCLPKDGIINEVVSLTVQTLALRCDQVYVIVDINNLSVIGWFQDAVLDWDDSNKHLLFLLNYNSIFAVSVKVEKEEEERPVEEAISVVEEERPVEEAASVVEEDERPVEEATSVVDPSKHISYVPVSNEVKDDQSLEAVLENGADVENRDVEDEGDVQVVGNGGDVEDVELSEKRDDVIIEVKKKEEESAERASDDIILESGEKEVQTTTLSSNVQMLTPSNDSLPPSPSPDSAPELEKDKEDEADLTVTIKAVDEKEEEDQELVTDSPLSDLDWLTGDNQSECSSMLSANSDNLPEMYPSPDIAEKSKLSQIESMTKGIFSLSPSPTKPKQLIRSEITLPYVEPDKSSMSSQETMSNKSGSSNFDEEDTIAVRIRKKKPRVRNAKNTTEEAPVTVTEAESTEILSLIVEEKDKQTIKNKSEENKAEEHKTLSEHKEECSENKEEKSEDKVQDVKTEEKSLLDVSSILDGLSALNNNCLDLDVLGLPQLQNSLDEDDDSGVEINHDSPDNSTELGCHSNCFSDQSTIICEMDLTPNSDPDTGPTTSTPLATTTESQTKPLATTAEDIVCEIPVEEEERQGRQYLYSEGSFHHDSESNTESEEETPEMRTDLDNTERSDVEMGEDPLSWENEGFPDYYNCDDTSKSMLQLDNSGSDTEVEVPSLPKHVETHDHHSGISLVSADNWVELRGPTVSRMYVSIAMIAVSNMSIWCIDSWGHVYCSPNIRGGSIEWKKVPGKLTHIDCSDSGYVVWGVSSNKRAIVRIGISPEAKEGLDWSEMMLESGSVAVDDTAVWLSMINNSIWYRYGITEDEPQGEKWLPITTPHLILSRISVNNNVVWAVNDTGKLVIRSGITSHKQLGTNWEVMPVSYVKECHVGRLKGCAWVVDTAGVVHFQCGVSPDKPKGSNIWWQVSVSEHLSPLASVQQLGLWTLTNLRKRALEVKQVCTSSQGGVWLLSNSATLHCRHGNIAGHNWANVSRTYIPGHHRWRYLVADGADEAAVGPVWGLTFTGDIICFTRSQAPKCLDTPLGVVIDCIGASINVLWALDNTGQIHIRGGMCDDTPFGTDWTQLDMVQLNKIQISKVSCSVRGVWAVDCKGGVWYRAGVTPRTHSHSVQAWLRVDSNIIIKQIVVGHVGWMVWALDTRGNVYMRNSVSAALPVGELWEHIPGVTCYQLCVSGTHVYGVTTGQQIVCRYGITLIVPAGNYWRKLPGPPPDGRGVRLLSSTINNSLWCEVRNGTIYRRRTKTIIDHTPSSLGAMDEDWEVL